MSVYTHVKLFNLSNMYNRPGLISREIATGVHRLDYRYLVIAHLAFLRNEVLFQKVIDHEDSNGNMAAIKFACGKYLVHDVHVTDIIQLMVNDTEGVIPSIYNLEEAGRAQINGRTTLGYDVQVDDIALSAMELVGTMMTWVHGIEPCPAVMHTSRHAVLQLARQARHLHKRCTRPIVAYYQQCDDRDVDFPVGHLVMAEAVVSVVNMLDAVAAWLQASEQDHE